MAAEGKLDPKQKAGMTVSDACEALLGSVQTHRPATIRLYTEKLSAFAGKFGDQLLLDVTPQQVIAWISSYQGTGGPRPYGDPSRALQLRYVNLLYRWARDTGIIAFNPLHGVTAKWRPGVRDRPMDEHEYEAVMARPRVSKEFKEVLEFMWRTGMRPGEIAVLSARHLDARKMIARLQPTEHKTGTKTGLQREIFFPPDLWARLQAYALIRKQGPLICRKNGKPWTGKKISSAYSPLKKKLGLTCVLYQARHRFFTNLVESGVPAARAAKIGGHNDAGTLMKHYYHPDVAQMEADVAVGAQQEEQRIVDITKQVEDARLAAENKQKGKDPSYHRNWRAIKKARAVIAAAKKNEASDT